MRAAAARAIERGRRLPPAPLPLPPAAVAARAGRRAGLITAARCAGAAGGSWAVPWALRDKGCRLVSICACVRPGLVGCATKMVSASGASTRREAAKTCTANAGPCCAALVLAGRRNRCQWAWDRLTDGPGLLTRNDRPLASPHLAAPIPTAQTRLCSAPPCWPRRRVLPHRFMRRAAGRLRPLPLPAHGRCRWRRAATAGLATV